MEGSNRLVLDPYRRWAEPLDEGVRRVLVLNLGSLTGSDSVRGVPWPRDWQPRWLLRLAIERLDADAHSVHLYARWSLQDGARQRAALERGSELSRSRSGTSAESIAADMSQLLAELSVRIVRAMDESDNEDGAAP